MSVYRYAVGETVEVAQGRFDGHVPHGRYVVTRQLPGAAEGREYRVRHQQDGHERVVLESRLRGVPRGVFA